MGKMSVVTTLNYHFKHCTSCPSNFENGFERTFQFRWPLATLPSHGHMVLLLHCQPSLSSLLRPFVWQKWVLMVQSRHFWSRWSRGGFGRRHFPHGRDPFSIAGELHIL